MRPANHTTIAGCAVEKRRGAGFTDSVASAHATPPTMDSIYCHPCPWVLDLGSWIRNRTGCWMLDELSDDRVAGTDHHSDHPALVAHARSTDPDPSRAEDFDCMIDPGTDLGCSCAAGFCWASVHGTRAPLEDSDFWVDRARESVASSQKPWNNHLVDEDYRTSGTAVSSPGQPRHQNHPVDRCAWKS